MRHQHARRGDFDHRHVTFTRDGGERPIGRGRLCGDASSRCLRPPAVQNAHRDVLVDRGQDRARMKHLGAEVRQLGRFTERQERHDVRRADQPRICGEHAVHIGPDLNFARVERRADDRRGIVRSAAAKRRGHALARCADEAADDRHPAFRDLRSDFPADRLARLIRSGRRCQVCARIGDDGAARVHPRRRHAIVLQRGGDNAAVDQFAGADDRVVRARRSGAQDAVALSSARRSSSCAPISTRRSLATSAAAAARSPRSAGAIVPRRHSARAHRDGARPRRSVRAVDR